MNRPAPGGPQSEYVDAETRDQLRQIGVEDDLVQKTVYVWPPLDADTPRHRLRLADGDHVSIERRPPRPNEMGPCEPGQSLCRELRREADDYGEAPPILDEHQREVPDDPEWSEYMSYFCRYCGHRCLNRRDSRYAEASVCRGCYPECDG